LENFLDDMGEHPSPDCQLHRKDVNGNYEPGNCVWVPKTSHLLMSKGNNRTFIWKGRLRSLYQICGMEGVPYRVVHFLTRTLKWRLKNAVSMSGHASREKFREGM